MQSLLLFISIVLAAHGGQTRSSYPDNSLGTSCTAAELRLSDVQGLKVYAPDGQRFLINAKDEKGTYQVYLGSQGNGDTRVCLTCQDVPGGPKRNRSKMQPHWHPSGRWIFLAVERDQYSPPPLLGLSRSYVEGQLQNGIWTNLYVISADGKQWFRLTDYKSGVAGVPDGFSGPAVTPDGKHVVLSQIVDGNVFKYRPFGRWQLVMADFDDRYGVPRLSNQTDITPPGMNWNEPGNFHPDGRRVLLSGSTESNAQGMDQYTLDVRTGRLVNLTQSPKIWDEHGRFSPDGSRILFMSSYPYRSDPKSGEILTIKTEFMMMDANGSNLQQITHYRQPGYPEYSTKGGIAANPEWSPDGRSANLARLFFPSYQYWDVFFRGSCGNAAR